MKSVSLTKDQQLQYDESIRSLQHFLRRFDIPNCTAIVSHDDSTLVAPDKRLHHHRCPLCRVEYTSDHSEAEICPWCRGIASPPEDRTIPGTNAVMDSSPTQAHHMCICCGESVNASKLVDGFCDDCRKPKL